MSDFHILIFRYFNILRTDFIIIVLIDYPLRAFVVNNLTKVKGQPVVQGLTDSFTMILILMMLLLFFQHSSTSLKILAVPNEAVFVHVLLSSQSQLLQHISRNQFILHLIVHSLAISFLSILYFSIFPTSLLFTRTSLGMVTSANLTPSWFYQ